MEAWIPILLSLALAFSLKFLLATKPTKKTLPPGPSAIVFFTKNMLFKKQSVLEFEQIIDELHKNYGSIVSLRGLAQPTIFIRDGDLAHKALVQKAAVFADHPPSNALLHYLSCGSCDISSSSYGHLSRLLRRNLTSEVLSPSCVKHFSPARQWALRVLLDKLRTRAELKNGRVIVSENFQFAVFCLATVMCFGEKFDEKQIKEIQAMQSFVVLLSITSLNPYNVLPRITKVVFRKKWDEIVGVKRRREEIFLPLVKARADRKLKAAVVEFPDTYVDTLFDLEIPEDGGRKLSMNEIVHLCFEFITASTVTVSTVLEWIMAELVKHQDIQRKLADEIETVMEPSDDHEIKEEDLRKMPYLKAVIMEGLRKHPMGPFLFPRVAAEDVELNGYLIPKGSKLIVNMKTGLDEKVWDDPTEFQPERFLQRNGCLEEAVDIKGSREIKMMPFGVGRRMCPGYGLGILHLEYFVASLVREFEWKAVAGEEVDMSEKFMVTTVMKKPLRAQIIPRTKK